MKIVQIAVPVLAALTLAACATPIGPVEVTRFHKEAALPQLGQGTIAIEAAPGMDGDSLELASYKSAVSRELTKIGYQSAAAGSGNQVALVRIERFAFQPQRDGGPVSVGVGGSTGSWGSGVGLGIGLNLSGKPAEQVTTRLGVMIKDRTSGETIWEGRAEFTVRADAPLATSQLGAVKIAEAMFRDFPGGNGETIRVQ
jgi:hypothetical protein